MTPADFLHLLFHDAAGDPLPGWIETRHLADTKGVPGIDRGWWALADLVAELPAINTEAQRRGDAVFFGVLPRRERGDGTAANAGDGMVAWCDLDFKDVKEDQARERIAAFPFPPSLTVHSGRGLHLYWLMQEPTEAATLREVSKRAANVLGGDHCFDAARILRMPGSRNLKACWEGNAYAFDTTAPEVVIESAPAHRYQAHDFEDLPEAPEPKADRETVLPTNAPIPSECPPKVKALIERQPRVALLWHGKGKTQGDLSNSGYDLSFAIKLIIYGIANPADLAAAIQSRPSTSKKPRSKREVWRTVDRALDQTRPSVQEQERTPPVVEGYAPTVDGSALAVLAVFADRVKAANGDAKALKRIEIELLHPEFLADLANCDAVEVAVALSEMQIKGFAGVLRKVEKAMSATAKAAKMNAHHQADARRKEREMEEEWPQDRTGKHPGVEAAMAYRKGQAVVCHANLILILRMDPRWSGRFRMNRMGDVLEFDGALIESEKEVVSNVTVWITKNYDIHFRLEDVSAAIYATADGYAYHPVRDYLKALPAWDGTDRIAAVLGDVLKVRVRSDDNPLGAAREEIALYQKFIRRFLVAAVARVIRPGCKMDTALILVGEQGARKSTFFKALFTARWFGDSPIPIGDKNAAIQLRATWGYECAELESLNKKSAEEVKQWMSLAADLFRHIYERNARSWPRHSVVAGTTNRPEFLTDPTGSRRFWPIPIPGNAIIDTALLAAWRDALWAQALALYRLAEAQGDLADEACRWWFEPGEDEDRAVAAQQFEVTDPWDSAVMEYVLVNGQKFTIAGILEGGIKMARERMDQVAKNRVGAILRRHGWRSKRARSETEKGKFIDVWVFEGRKKDDPEPVGVPPVPAWRGQVVPINDDGVPF